MTPPERTTRRSFHFPLIYPPLRRFRIISIYDLLAVALAAAVGKPDALRTEIVKAFLVLRPGFAPSNELKSEIAQFVKERLSAHEYPREIEFVADLPMTTTGKIIRRELRARC